MKQLFGISLLFCALPVSAMNSLDYKNELPHLALPFSPYMGVYTGYGEIENMRKGEGQTAIQRLAIGVEAMPWWRINLGLEVGVQSGNTMRHSSNPLLLTDSIQFTLKPMIDLLATARFKIVPGSSVYIFAKGGGAYRRMQVSDVVNIPSLHQWNGELQIGAGYEVTPNARVSAFYQEIFSKDCACVSVDPVTLSGKVKGIPEQNAGFIGFEYSAL